MGIVGQIKRLAEGKYLNHCLYDWKATGTWGSLGCCSRVKVECLKSSSRFDWIKVFWSEVNHVNPTQSINSLHKISVSLKQLASKDDKDLKFLILGQAFGAALSLGISTSISECPGLSSENAASTSSPQIMYILGDRRQWLQYLGSCWWGQGWGEIGTKLPAPGSSVVQPQLLRSFGGVNQ